jgi:hypothetical protein
MDGVLSHPVALLWMGVVVVSAWLLAKGIVDGLTAITQGLTACGRRSEDKRERHAEVQARLHGEWQEQLQEQRQAQWRERHRHLHPQCEVCKREAERPPPDPAAPRPMPFRRIV